ncbi:acetyl-CoA carboxylase, carboxyltransferase subunit beta [Priestia megaterium]|uniref:acetyl-CoA carboxylase, carboxyltransferase subunit beta n=1 Tax=Priestia megaterium TaxID=1404 RepID=UPI0030C92767
MINGIFLKKKKYASVPIKEKRPFSSQGVVTKCPKCKKLLLNRELDKNLKTCNFCKYHFPMTASERIKFLLDENSFIEYNENMQSRNPLHFPGYTEKIRIDEANTGLKEAVITGQGTIKGYHTALAIMDTRFRMGSMGSVVGEKIALAMERAMEQQLPFLIFTASGGARMQEGVVSLMQMAKTSSVVKLMDRNKNLFISIMTSPTTGGVSASFASLGDYNFAEPGALIGFAGRRIIEQTIREDLPENFQTAEFLLEHGQLDKIIDRFSMRDTLASILSIHQGD